MATKRWGIWCISTKGWVHDGGDPPRIITCTTRGVAKVEMDEFTIKETRKDYEVREYK